MSTALAETAGFRTAFERLGPELGATQPEWLGRRRHEALGRFERLGFPTTRDEAWRHTNLAPLLRIGFRDVREAGLPAPATGLLDRVRPPRVAGPRVVFVNGRLAPQLSQPVPEGIRVRSLREALSQRPDTLEDALEDILGRVAGSAAALRALNTALFEDGALVEIAPGHQAEAPVHLVFVALPGSAAPLAIHPRVLVVAGRGSRASVVESHLGDAEGVYLSNVVTEIVIEDSARLDHYKLQLEGPSAFHLATIAVRQGRDSRFDSHAISLGGVLARNDIETLFDGEGGECSLDGLFVGAGDQLLDTHTRIDHAVPHCRSRELYKGILTDRARGVFDGVVMVRQDAQQTSAEQTNKNLLLSDESLVNSTPRLLILADDVKCRHGSTTGQLDPAALFYLRSRGIDALEARSLLTHAFASEVLGRLELPGLHAEVEGRLQERLPVSETLEEAVV
jgi:Fe-S cluster assembly protein SufD